MSSFAQMKQNRQSQLANLTTELEKTQTVTSYVDDRIWKCERDKSGNGYAVIRFLPPSEGEDLPWIRVWDHGFQGPGGWYIENSLTTLQQNDPVSEYNTSLWNNGTQSGKDQARKQKRRLNYYSNILVIKDPANPENEGEVRIFRYGKKIFDKINDVMNPEFEDESPVNPFDLWTGANFKIKVRMVEGYVNYDKSEFDPISPLAGDDETLQSVWEKQYPLNDFLSEDKFKSYGELKAKLNRVLGIGIDDEEVVARTIVEDDEPDIPSQASEESTETLSYFQKLANEEY